MECLLQCLDELDDLVAAVLYLSERIRMTLLLPGVVATLLVPAAAFEWALVPSPATLVQLSLASLSIWSAFGACAYFAERRISPTA